MLLRWDPFREIDRMVSDDTWRSLTRSAAAGVPMDAFRRGDTFHVLFDVPGVDPSTVELTVEKNVLTVKAERSWTREDGDEVIAAERPRGTFTRQLFLGDSLDTGRIDARVEHGVLHLTIPVAEAAKPRRVEIQANGHATARKIDAERVEAIEATHQPA